MTYHHIQRSKIPNKQQERPLQEHQHQQQQQQQQQQQRRRSFQSHTLDSHYSKAPYYTDGKLRQHMGSSASSNNATTSSGAASSSHRGSLPPGVLPGGNDWYAGTAKYRSGTSNRQTYLLKEKVHNPHGPPPRGSSSRSSGGGPMKADHNIGIPTGRESSGSSRDRYGGGILRPMSRQKSSSLSDLSMNNYRDITADIEDRSATGELSRKSHGVSLTRGMVSDARTLSRPLHDDVHASFKSKGGVGSSRQSNVSQYERIVDGVRTMNTGGSKPPRDDLAGSRSGSDGGRLSRRYHSLSDLNATSSTTSSFPGVKASTPSTTRRFGGEYEESRTSPVVVGGRRSGSVSEGTRGSASVSTSTGRSHSLENGKTNTPFGCGLVGLRNLGNTCFMNSILQCLCKTKLLREYFFKRHYQNDLNEDHAPTKGRLAKAFGQLMLDMWSKKEEEYITPSQLKAEVQKYAVRFSGYHQQDAQEFLRFFIEGVHDDLNSVKRKPVYSSIDDTSMKDGKKSEIFWERYLSREKSMIQDLFVGQLKSTLTCTVCEHRSVTYDPFWDLSLPIPSRTKTEEVNITRCFRAFTQEEILDGDEKPTCEKCKKRRKCTKRFQIEIFPKILVIHLKRFSGTRYRTKLDTKVTFPFELNLTEFAADSTGSRKQNPTYSLYGVSNHMGGTHGGHYTAYCKHPDTDRWHGYNDSRVSEISSSKTVSSSAYVLFYELCSNGTSTG